MKRSRDVFDTPLSSSPPNPPSKRHLSAAACSSPSASTSYVVRTPSSPWASAIAHDSPSNPFGLDRPLRALTLPRPSGFGKHIVLRLQVIFKVNSRTRRIPPPAPFRIVQVPLNYSFRLLHMLILFLLASDAALQVRRPSRVFSRPSRHPRQLPSSLCKPKAERNVLPESRKKERAHLFEVFDEVSLCANRDSLGVIEPKFSNLYARLSSVRERRLFPNGTEDDDEDNDMSGISAMPLAQKDHDDAEGWDWEAEDDFLLSNVWTDGPDLKKGIIYHHTPSTVIHITVNLTRVATRKGVGNTPFVFTAEGGTSGAVRIFNLASGLVPISDDKGNLAEKPFRRKKAGDALKKAKVVPLKDEFDDVEDLDNGQMATEAQLNRWNDQDAFDRFLKREAARERAMRGQPDSARSPVAVHKLSRTPASQRPSRANRLVSASSPGAGSSSQSRSRSRSYSPRRTYNRSYTYAIPNAASSFKSLPPSSPSQLPVPLGLSDVEFDVRAGWSDVQPSSDVDTYPSSDAEEIRRAPVYQIELPLETPVPAHAAVRRRVARVGKRMERATSKGLSELSDSDVEEEDKEVVREDKVKGKGKGKEEEDPEWGQGSPSKMPSRASSRCSERGVLTEHEDDGEEITARGRAVNAKAVAFQPPVVAAKGPAVLESPEDEDERDELEDYGDERDDEDSEDELWDVGPTWFQPPDDDWDSEDEL